MYYQFEGGVAEKGALLVFTDEHSAKPYCVCAYNGKVWQQVAPLRTYFGVAVRDMRKLLQTQ